MRRIDDLRRRGIRGVPMTVMEPERGVRVPTKMAVCKHCGQTMALELIRDHLLKAHGIRR